MMIKQVVIKFFIGFLVLCSSLYSQLAMADGVTSLRDFFNNTSTMRAQFSQVVNDNKGRKVQEVEGTMQLQRPNKFRWDYKKPYEQQIVSDGKQVFLFDTELQQVTIRDLSKTLGSSPAAMLAGGEAVEKNFSLKAKQYALKATIFIFWQRQYPA